jgi:hypothetical protein
MEYLREDGKELHITYTPIQETVSLIFSVYDEINSQYLYYNEAVGIDNNTTFDIVLPIDVSRYDRKLRLDLQGITENSYYDDVLYAELVRPFAQPEEINAYFLLFPGMSSNAGLEPNVYEALERKARYLITSYTNDAFKFEYKTVGAYGANTDLLHLGQRIESFDKITYDDYVVYDSTEEPILDMLGANIAIAPSKTAIKVVAEGVNISEWVDQNPLNNPSYFGKDAAYLVRGEYGWSSHPEEIKVATFELINDLLCNDYIYRNKGLKSIQNDAFNIQFADGMLSGTGNLYVDALLAPYKVWNLKAI